MNDGMVPVTAEWAVWGKEADHLGYGLLRYSDGIVQPGDFEQLITRYSPGTVDGFPQVTVNGFSIHDRPAYLALAIHDYPEHPHQYATRRRIVETRCYCVQFSQLAGETVSYQAMYECFRGIGLQGPDRDPVRTEVLAARPAPVTDGVAMRVASLLITGRPVCILGAEGTELGERLRFLDAVASLLPYGMRAGLSAATWASATARHHLRLYFSSAVRGDSRHHVAYWGRPDLGPTGDRSADDYLAWLRADAVQRAAQLAAQTDETGFSPEDIKHVLARLGIRPGQPEDESQPGSLPLENLLVGHLLSRGTQPADWVRRALKEAVQRGLLVFNPPDEMKHGRKERVEVGIARSAALREALTAGLHGHGEPQFEEIDTSSFMGVELIGDSFEITPLRLPEQIVEPLARWEFDVLPKQAGLQDLILSVYLRVVLAKRTEINGQGLTVRVLERKIRIRVSVRYSTRRFLVSNWQWLIATAAGLGAGITAWVEFFH
jgi:hypothetical protein